MNGVEQEAQAGGNEGPDLGVLFVHGVGHQIAGDTLVQFGDPVLRWISEWFRFGLKLEVESTGKKLEQLTAEELAQLEWGWVDVNKARVSCEEGIPANANVEIGIWRKGRNWSQRWIVAESCWANAFVTPTFRALAFWGLVVYPWTNASHYGAQIRRSWRAVTSGTERVRPRPWSRALKMQRRLAQGLAWIRTLFVIPALLVGSVVVSILVVAALLLLLLLAIPPIPSLRAMLLRLQQSLADSLGDSFILAASPIQKAAIVSHVRRDLEWLIEQKCRKIALVAHSQGAAVAFETMATGIVQGRRRGNTLLLTFGSGLGKLREIESAVGSDKPGKGWRPIFGLTLLMASLEFFNFINLIPFLGSSFALGFLCGFFGFLFWLGGVAEGARNLPAPKDFVLTEKFGADVRWRDYYASHDPVSNGPLFDEEQSFLESVEVHNRASLWSDHTTYWVNRDEFVPFIVGDLASLSRLPIPDIRPGDQDRVAEAAGRRAWRVRWLGGARLAAWVMAALIILLRLRDLQAWGAAALGQLPLVEKLVGWIGGEMFRDVRVAAHPVAQLVMGVTLVMLLVAVGYHVVYFIWQVWTWRDTRALMRREGYGNETLYWIFVLATLTLTNAGFLVSLGWLLGKSAPSELGEGMNAVWYPLIPGYLAGCLVFVFRLLAGSILFVFRLLASCAVFVFCLLKRQAPGPSIRLEGERLAVSIRSFFKGGRLVKGIRSFASRVDSAFSSAFAVILEGVVIGLLGAPLIAVTLMVGSKNSGGWDDWAKLGIIAIIVSACWFISKGSTHIWPERQLWNPGAQK